MDCPWLLFEPNEKEGRKLLAEIMQGGNFGQYGSLTMGFIDHISTRRGRPYGLIYALSKQISSNFCITKIRKQSQWQSQLQ